MATFSSTTYTGQLAGREMTAAPGLRSSVYSARFQIPLTSAAALNDILNFGFMPKDAVIEDAELISDDLDTGGPTITIDVGDALSGTRLFSASTVAQAGTRGKCLQTAMGYQYPARTAVTGLIKAAATTPAAGNLTLIIYYKLPGNPVS